MKLSDKDLKIRDYLSGAALMIAFYAEVFGSMYEIKEKSDIENHEKSYPLAKWLREERERLCKKTDNVPRQWIKELFLISERLSPELNEESYSLNYGIQKLIVVLRKIQPYPPKCYMDILIQDIIGDAEKLYQITGKEFYFSNEKPREMLKKLLEYEALPIEEQIDVKAKTKKSKDDYESEIIQAITSYFPRRLSKPISNWPQTVTNDNSKKKKT